MVLPSRNERENIAAILNRISDILSSVDYEIVVVDDNSPDGTAQIVQECSLQNSRIKLVSRFNERGLSSAVLLGFKHASGKIVGVMDADGSHDPSILPQMIKLIQKGECDCVVASRKAAGGGFSGYWPWYRKIFSGSATWAVRILLGLQVKDPMSGFFCMSREAFLQIADLIHPRGFKILLEILAIGRFLRVIEVPYFFTDRTKGKSKLSVKVVSEFIVQLMHLTFRLSHSTHSKA